MNCVHEEVVVEELEYQRYVCLRCDDVVPDVYFNNHDWVYIPRYDVYKLCKTEGR